ncbi:hypothetical protein T440DRAFT_27074 [Plenodomus tracheiphilus IPT5]|uniref:Transcription factor domain-containing protein n=1 Tax=Plenodomus tracheiphilus IPT5 TaxID=1408161 RepID=A0A6A7APS4_9PLEO|nr:hypothetical protein T440DRAFT_27074 [Plenodomus tracheiphilus IPT5]
MTKESIAALAGGVGASYGHNSNASLVSSSPGQFPRCPSSNAIVSSSHSLSASSRPSGSQGQEENGASPRDSVDTEDLYPERQPQDTTSPVKSGMEEVHHVVKCLGIQFQATRVAAMPLEDMTTKAVEAFLNGTGSLLFFWGHAEALELIRSVYHPRSDSTPAYATEVFAMSAVGSYCDGEAHTTLVQERCLHSFLYMLSLPSNMSNLRRMRLFACLAICLYTNSIDSARRLILSALRIGRQTFTSPTFRAETSEDEVLYWWNVLRSIIFLECWFAYNTGHESRITPEDLTLHHPSRPHADLGVFQERVGNLGQLAAYIALDLKTETQPTAARARIHFESLDEWHRTLPPQMQLSQLSLTDPLAMNRYSKRSLLQLHVLFLGLLIEPYRRGLVNLGRYRLNNSVTTIALEDLEPLENVEEQCALVARQSARVASLLQTDNLIRSRCWVSVYTSFTGCAVLLFSASQKLLKLLGEEIGQDLLYAASHLNVLSLCSYDNAVARKLYITLQIIFNDLREIVVSPVYHRMRELHIVVQDVALMPPSHYDAAGGVGEVSKSIVELVRRMTDVLQENLSF